MTLPTLEKTWQVDANNLCGGSATLEVNCDEIWLTIISALLGFGSGAAVVWGSCDGSGAGGFGNNDGVNRWIDTGDLVHNTAGSDHSWMVLTFGSGVQCCIDLNYNAAPSSATLVASIAGFASDGTRNSRPTATDEMALDSGIVMPQGAGYTHKVHALQSTDGFETRVFVYRNSVCHTMMVTGIAKNIPASLVWGGKYIAFRGANGTDVCSYAELNDGAAARTVIDSDACSMYFTGEGADALLTGEIQTVADEDTNDWPISPIGLQASTVGHRGRKGAVSDLWWGATNVNNGDTYPDDATKQFVQFGSLVIPWNGTTPEVV